MISGNDGLWQKEGGIFSFGYFVRSVFVWKTLVFRFWCSLWFTDFPFFSIWFLVFMKNTNGFSVLISNMIFGFSYLTYFIWFWFLLDLSSNYAPPLILLDANVIERNAWQTNWNIAGIPWGFTCLEWHPRLWSSIGFHAPWMTPRLWPCGALRSRLINMWTMSSNMPNTLVMEEGQLWIVLCLWRWERWQEFQREKQV